MTDTRHRTEMKRGLRQVILDAIVDLHNAEQVVTRKVVLFCDGPEDEHRGRTGWQSGGR